MLLWDLETGQELRTFQRPDPLTDTGSSGMAFSPDGKTAISCEQDGVLIEWDLENGKEIRRLASTQPAYPRGDHPGWKPALTSGNGWSP